jgi:hypothetical protein
VYVVTSCKVNWAVALLMSEQSQTDVGEHTLSLVYVWYTDWYCTVGVHVVNRVQTVSVVWVKATVWK